MVTHRHGAGSSPQVAADRAHHHLAGVQPHTDLRTDTVDGEPLLGVLLYGVLHAQRRVAGSDRVILVGEGGAEEGHDPVAHDLVDRPLVAVDRFHHPFEDRIEDGAGFLGVAVSKEFHGALKVGEEHCHLLALAFERGPRRQDALGEVPGCVALR
jgi:hypothetical protein